MPSVDGLISGLSTSDLIGQLMQIERQPQARLQTRTASITRTIDAWNGLNTRFAALRSALEKLVEPSGWRPVRATSSAPAAVSVSAAAATPPATLTFSVQQLARAASYVSNGTVASRDEVVTAPGVLLLTKGGVTTELSTEHGTLGELVDAVNAAKAGVTAAAVQVAPGSWRLQLSSTTTGTASSFTLTDADSADALATGALGGLVTTTAGQDAVIRIGDSAPYDVTRPSNTISDLLDGVTLTLVKADPATAVTVQVAADGEAVADQVRTVVDAANATLAELARLGAMPKDGRSGGPLAGNALVRNLQQQIVSSVANAVPGNSIVSPGLAGVELKRDGAVTFDRQRFLEAVERDPDAVQAVLGAGTAQAPGVVGRLRDLADRVTAPVSGDIASMISGRQSDLKSVQNRIEAWDVRLALKQRALQRQFTGLETALNAMKQQSQWLAGQIAGLASNTGGS